VYITNFSCGPDSFITKYFDREMAGKPYLSIELDEHSADAGIITRLEAYLDSLRPAAAPGAVRRKSTAAPRARNNTNHRKVYIPYMDDHGLMLAAAMRHRGIDAEALPMADESSIALGRRYTTGKECYPCIITTGDIVRKAMADDFSPERSCFFMPSAMGPCRFGQYNRFHRHVLNELGLGSVELLVLDQTTDYDSTLSALGPGFRLLGWQGLIVIDFLKKLQLHTRPYELNPGETDAVYAQCLDALVSCVEQSGTIGSCAQDAARRFKAIPADRSRQKPLIGIVGEIFVRSNRFSNDFIIERIEQCGGEVVMPTLQEWVSYTDWERRKDFRREGPLSRFLLELFKGGIQSREVKKIKKAFTGTIPHFFSEPATAEVMRLCGPYLPEDIRGEATLSMGRCVEYAQHGCHGIVNVIPFNCMPGTIVNTLLCRFARDYPHLPILKMVYDGTRQSGDHTRIEAFMHQASHARDRTAASSRACP
jgi:predicted nucleotide-binding protein (sugar kinase/HSP70/actin superfamily)